MATAKKNIFISYRVQDTAGETGRLVDTLKQYFDDDQIFMDIDKLEPGVDFTQVIEKSLEACDVMLAVIGPNWEGKGADGRNRIQNEDDWVRLELGTALKRNIRVVPVLVDGGTLPADNELPHELKPLLKRQAYEISNKRWKYDTDNLVNFLIKGLGIPPKNSQEHQVPDKRKNNKLWISLFAVIGIALVLALTGVFNSDKRKQSIDPQVPIVTGYWSNEDEEFGFDIDQRDKNLYGSLYRKIVDTSTLLTNKGEGIIEANNLTLNFAIPGETDTTYYNLTGVLSSNGKYIRSTFIITNSEDSTEYEMNLTKTDY
ncbi:MAG TPA: toll/interleukin-1 receptor domain-containing protein [Chitinophagaceae bacterium]|nr:toll/interleukin-1 receptor domain-containing protein [Chitinophagaceae bacterium]